MSDKTVSIEILLADFERLKLLAEPFVDSPATVITRILDIIDSNGAPSEVSVSNDKTALIESEERIFSPDSLPNLTHTRLIGGTFDGETPEKYQWDSLFRIALRRLYDSTLDISKMREVSGANIAEGNKNIHGYRPFPGRPFSYQGQSAEDIARYMIRIARALKLDAEIRFEWREKNEAAFPGQKGKIFVQASGRL